MRSSIASAAFSLSAAIQFQIVSRSVLARLRSCTLLAISFSRQPCATPPLHVLNHLVDVDFLTRTVETLLDSGAQRFQLGFAALLAFLDQAQTVAHDLARGGVAAAL